MLIVRFLNKILEIIRIIIPSGQSKGRLDFSRMGFSARGGVLLLLLPLLVAGGGPLGTSDWDSVYGPAHFAAGGAHATARVRVRGAEAAKGVMRKMRSSILRQPQATAAGLQGEAAAVAAGSLEGEGRASPLLESPGGGVVGGGTGGGEAASSVAAGQRGGVAAAHAGNDDVAVAAGGEQAHAKSHGGAGDSRGKKFEMWGEHFPNDAAGGAAEGAREGGGDITVIEEGVPSAKGVGGVSTVAADFPSKGAVAGAAGPVAVGAGSSSSISGTGDRDPYGGASSVVADAIAGLVPRGRQHSKAWGSTGGSFGRGLADGDGAGGFEPLEDAGGGGVEDWGGDDSSESSSSSDSGAFEQPEGEGAEEDKVIEKVFDFSKITYAEIPLHHWAWLTAVGFVVLTCVISSTMILRHLDLYARPDVQKYVVRILFMAPIYAVDALLSLT